MRQKLRLSGALTALPVLVLLLLVTGLFGNAEAGEYTKTGYTVQRDPARPLVVIYPPQANGYRKVLIFDPYKTTPSRSFFIDAYNRVVNQDKFVPKYKLSGKYANDIEKNAEVFGVDPALIKAVIHAESGFNPEAVSRVGAAGLMQLMPATAERMGVGDRFNPGQNITGGVRYLATLLKIFGNPELAIAAYNAGEGAVFKYGGIPPYKETQHYVTKVMALWKSYREQG